VQYIVRKANQLASAFLIYKAEDVLLESLYRLLFVERHTSNTKRCAFPGMSRVLDRCVGRKGKLAT
jgi:hypothetical protein